MVEGKAVMVAGGQGGKVVAEVAGSGGQSGGGSGSGYVGRESGSSG